VRQVLLYSLIGVPRVGLLLVDQYLSLLVVVTLVAAVIGAAYSHMVAAFTLALMSCVISLLQPEIERRMGHKHHPRLLQRYFTYCRQAPFTPFIIAFMVLLILATSALSLQTIAVADSIAIYAYYFLVIGIGVQLIDYIRSIRTKEKIDMRMDS
jgi:large-conductance mechanosensitive channel